MDNADQDEDKKKSCYCSKCQGKRKVSKRTMARHLDSDSTSIDQQIHELQDKDVGKLSDTSGEVEFTSLMEIINKQDDERNHALFEGCKWSSLAFHVALLDIKARHPGFTQGAFTSVLRIVKIMLEQSGISNKIAENYEKAYSLVKDLLPPHKEVPVCVGDCMLANDKPNCEHCGELFLDEKGSARKKYYYLPLLPRIAQLYDIPVIARDLQSHGTKEKSNLMTDIQDSTEWQALYETNGQFQGEARSLALAYNTDGGNPYHHVGVEYSVWPQLVKIYNLPVEMRDKLGNILLVGMVPGPKAPKNMNTFHEMLVKEMAILNNGVKIYDSHRKEFFNLKVDIINYSLDWQAHCKCCFQMAATAHSPCPFCTLEGEYQPRLKKMVFFESRKFLQIDDPMRKDKKSFPDRTLEVKRAKSRSHHKQHGEAVVALEKELAQCKIRKTKISLRKRIKRLKKKTGKTGVEIFYKLKKYDIKRVVLDLMHLGKNTMHALHAVITGTQENITGYCQEEIERGRFQGKVKLSQETDESQPITDVESNDNIKQKKKTKKKIGVVVGKKVSRKGKRVTKKKVIKAPFVASKEKMSIANERMKSIKVPVGYPMRPEKLKNLAGRKSIHWIEAASDGIFKFCFRGTLAEEQQKTLTSFLRIMELICSQAVPKNIIASLQVKLDRTVAMLERDFPVGMRTLQFHLLHHVMECIRTYGPLVNTWMFPFERMMSFIMRRMTSRKHPEVSTIHALKSVGVLPNLQPSVETSTNEAEASFHEITGSGDVDELQLHEQESEEEVEGLLYLRKGKPLPQQHDVKMSSYLRNYFFSKYDSMPDKIIRCKKFYAPVVKHPTFKREIIYRCQEGEERLKVETVSSVVGTFFGSLPYFGRISHFLMIETSLGIDEVAYVDWYGRGKWDGECELWFCDNDKKRINPVVHVTALSKPLVHSWEDTTLWVLNFNIESTLRKFWM